MEAATAFLAHFYARTACLLTSGIPQSRYGSDRIERLDVCMTSISTTSERPIFDVDKLGVETRTFLLLTLRGVPSSMDLDQLTVV